MEESSPPVPLQNSYHQELFLEDADLSVPTLLFPS